MFTALKTRNGHVMGDAYSGFQKAMRDGDERMVAYWGFEIAAETANALKLRILYVGFEDLSEREAMLKVLAIGSGKGHTATAQNIPVLMGWALWLARRPKTHSPAWLNRCIAEDLLASGAPAESFGELLKWIDPDPDIQIDVELRQQAVRKAARAALVMSLDAETRTAMMNMIDPELLGAYRHSGWRTLVWICGLLWREGVLPEGASGAECAPLPVSAFPVLPEGRIEFDT